MIKAVFFDIDGTLISFKTHRMPGSARLALQKLREKGIKTFAASGRAPNDTDFLKEYFDFDGVVSFNGQYCFNQNGVIYKNPMPAGHVKNIIPYLTRKNIACCFEMADRNVFNLLDERVFGLLDLVGMSHAVPVCEDVSALKDDIYQLTAYVTQDEEEEFMHLLPGCKAVRWYPTFVNVIVRDGGKPVGIGKMAEHYGFCADEIMVFGDGGNDIDMLKYAGIGIAMGGAADDVKAAADYVTDDVDGDGIFNALKYFKLV